ncbi:hypothetical protein [Paraburkholderia gardini]|uniref:DUF982 domain-containing protein n=1 Tax=Paraburkholderia gardini TaxID=2823469 RepID=A0ABN7QRR1_9BURK|nr:hypothetical protein [Paraburkholderia gardini]CAG4907435.1 hypothetical protein R54767_03406 [Paraburkholderia gardini]
MNKSYIVDNSARVKLKSFAAIKDAAAVLKPWFDDPKTHEAANMCMIVAPLAGLLRTSGKAGAEVEAAAMLQQLSETSKIPLSVLSTFADGSAAMLRFAERERPTTNTRGKKHG